MKRIWIAFALIIAIGGVCVCEHILTVNMFDTLGKAISDVKKEVKAENQETALENLEKITDDWYDYQKCLSIFLSHDVLQKTDSSVTAIKSQIDIRNFIDALTETEILEKQLNEIKETEEVTIENIL